MRLFLAWLVVTVVGACASRPEPATTPRRLGDLMDEAELRFHHANSAVLASRWDLARNDLHELEQLFSPEVATSWTLRSPQLASLAQQFQTERLASLVTAVNTHDVSAFEMAARDAARACNGCHRTADHASVEISDNFDVR
jgi:hypothetical protein